MPRLGIDISKLTFDVHLCLPTGGSHSAQFTNNDDGFAQLDTWLARHKASKTRAGLEATGPYGVLLLWHLHTSGHQVHQLNPRRVKDYSRSQGRRVKTDATDAALIAAYLKASEDLQPWQPASQALQDLQALVRRRSQVVTSLNAERNRKEKRPGKTVAASVDRIIEVLKDEVTKLDADIDALVLRHNTLQKSLRLLQSIDGVGRKVAVTILAEVPHISAFGRARDVAAFAGLTPSLCESGTSVRKRGRMSKEGSALLRKMLYMAALQAVKRTTNAFHSYYLGFVARGKAKMCALGAIMHKIIRIAFGVLKHDTPFVANLAKMEA
ncbi:MAG: IS110 family transposase [Prosthecobacter sp.]